MPLRVGQPICLNVLLDGPKPQLLETVDLRLPLTTDAVELVIFRSERLKKFKNIDGDASTWKLLSGTGAKTVKKFYSAAALDQFVTAALSKGGGGLGPAINLLIPPVAAASSEAAAPGVRGRPPGPAPGAAAAARMFTAGGVSKADILGIVAGSALPATFPASSASKASASSQRANAQDALAAGLVSRLVAAGGLQLSPTTAGKVQRQLASMGGPGAAPAASSSAAVLMPPTLPAMALAPLAPGPAAAPPPTGAAAAAPAGGDKGPTRKQLYSMVSALSQEVQALKGSLEDLQSTVAKLYVALPQPEEEEEDTDDEEGEGAAEHALRGSTDTANTAD